MYFVIVIATTIVLPIGSALIEFWLSLQPFVEQHTWVYPDFSGVVIMLLGKWYMFWAGGVRLFLAGMRQTFAPAMTVKQIFGIEHRPSEHIAQELGFANLSMGLICLLSLPYPQMMQAGALATGLFYGLAGMQHVLKPGRNAQRTVAMVTDLLVFAVLATYFVAFATHQIQI